MSKVALIADEDEYFRLALGRILERNMGFTEVIEAASLGEAIERLEETDGVSLAIFDLSMSGIDSPATLRSMRESHRVEKLVVVSASLDRGDVLCALGAGAHGFVFKGRGVDEFQSALREILEGRIYVPGTLAELNAGALPESDTGLPARPGSWHLRLTRRQGDVLELLMAGKSNREIADALELRPGTVKVHLAGLFRALGVTNRTAAAITGTHLLGHSFVPAGVQGSAPGPSRTASARADDGMADCHGSPEAVLPGE